MISLEIALKYFDENATLAIRRANDKRRINCSAYIQIIYCDPDVAECLSYYSRNSSIKNQVWTISGNDALDFLEVVNELLDHQRPVAHLIMDFFRRYNNGGLIATEVQSYLDNLANLTNYTPNNKSRLNLNTIARPPTNPEILRQQRRLMFMEWKERQRITRSYARIKNRTEGDGIEKDEEEFLDGDLTI